MLTKALMSSIYVTQLAPEHLAEIRNTRLPFHGAYNELKQFKWSLKAWGLQFLSSDYLNFFPYLMPAMFGFTHGAPAFYYGHVLV